METAASAVLAAVHSTKQKMPEATIPLFALVSHRSRLLLTA
jgi:hypothetical protein